MFVVDARYLDKIFDTANGPKEERIEYENLQDITTDFTQFDGVTISNSMIYKNKIPVGKIFEIGALPEL